MTVTATTEPTYIMPARVTEVTCSASVGNWVRVVLTAAPAASKYAKRLIDENRSELPLWVAQSGQKHKFTFDAPGSYVCTVREYTRGGVSFGGDHLDDPDGFPTETAVGSTAVTFLVGQKMTAPISLMNGREKGTLTLYVWGSTIRATTVPVHGEKSPRLDGDTPRMKTAAVSTSVAAALAALVNVACATAAPSLKTPMDNIITQWNAHVAFTTGSVHSGADAVNAIDTDFKGATTAEALRDTIQSLAGKFRGHFLNDSGTGTGSAAYHAVAADWDNLPIVSGVGDVLSASLALASLWYSYEAHRVDTGVHTAGDTTNTLTALAPLYAVYKAIIGIVQTDNPTAPSVDNAGATLLVSRAGLSKA